MPLEVALDEAWKRAFRQALLEWFRLHRRDLPWRRTRDPYAIWVAEIMLQQTQVATVIPYYQRFLARFPTLQRLAEASSEEVLKLWEGLGYYSRARHLHEAAKRVVREFGGQLPQTVDRLRELPGVGRYTAGAVASLAFNQPVPVVDGNVTRVLARLFWLKGNLRKPAAQNLLWRLTQELVDPEQPGDFNQAIMELGATVCLPAEPECGGCPVSRWCEAFRRGEPDALPEPGSLKRRVQRTDISALIWNGEAVLIGKRREQGLWGGLWEFPRVQRQGREDLAEGACRAAQQTLGVAVEPITVLAQVKHQVTYHAIRLVGYLCRYRSGEPQSILYEEWRWVPPDAFQAYPMSAPQRRLAQALQEQRHLQQKSLFELL